MLYEVIQREGDEIMFNERLSMEAYLFLTVIKVLRCYDLAFMLDTWRLLIESFSIFDVHWRVSTISLSNSFKQLLTMYRSCFNM